LVVVYLRRVKIVFSFFGGITILPRGQNRFGITSSFTIGLCVGSGRIVNVLVMRVG